MMAASKTRPVIAADATDDPLVIAINRYRFDGDAYDELAETVRGPELNEAFDRLVQEHTDTLTAWQAPARSIDGVAAALRIIAAELELSGEEPLAESMARAALGFFEGPTVPAAFAAAPGASLGGGAVR
jgi:hypothetical protein